MMERGKDKNEEREKEERSKEGSGKKRIKKGSKQDKKRNRKVVLWVLVITIGVSLIFYLSAWWNERGVNVKKKEEGGIEMREEKEEKVEDDFVNGWGKPAVYEF